MHTYHRESGAERNAQSATVNFISRMFDNHRLLDILPSLDTYIALDISSCFNVYLEVNPREPLSFVPIARFPNSKALRHYF